MNNPTELNIDADRPELQGFREFYTRKIEPHMAGRRNQQRTARRWLLGFGPTGLVVTGLVGWLMFRSYGLNWLTVTLPSTMAVVTGFLSLEKVLKLRSVIKGILVGKVCQFFGFGYDQEAKSVGFQTFDESGLLPPYDRRDPEDKLHGSRNEVEFDLFECRLWNRKGVILDQLLGTTDDPSYLGYNSKIYHGILLRFRFSTPFNGRTWVIQDSGLVRKFVEKQNLNAERIKLEDPRFANRFEVWSSDPMESRFLLTPAFIDRICGLGNAINSKRLEVCFLNNLSGFFLLISAPVRKNQFEVGGWFADVNDKRYVESLVSQICCVFDIVDTLQLTLKTRI